MNIYATEGTRVRFRESCIEQVRWGSNDDPDKTLNLGKIYTVSRTEVHSMHTKVYLAEFPDFKFNAVSFSETKAKR
jgi:hypothetical protein